VDIIHNIGLNADLDDQITFRNIGIELELGITAFKISENDPRWGAVSLLAKNRGVVDMPFTKFTASELKAAEYLEVFPTWHHGYPEPSDDFGYREATYDVSDRCEKCGIGKRQIAPFRMKRAPVWGSKSILQLNWIFDEYFVKPDVWSAIFEPLGVSCRPVVLNRTGAVIDSVVQLDVTTTVNLDFDGFPYEICPTCGRKKYLPVTRGFYPKPDPTNAAAFKSIQWWGSGASANKAFLVSNELYRKINEAKLKGVGFYACAK
jgi:hypothetical protein